MIEEKTSTRDWSSTLRISKTQMQTYLMCPRKFYFQYVVALPWEFTPSSLPFGKALHEAVGFYYQNLKNGLGTPDIREVIAEFQTSWRREIADREVLFDSSNRESLEGLGTVLLQRFYADVRPRKVEAVEYPFAVPLYDPEGGRLLEYKLVGLVDLIESDDDGHFIVSELKTSSKRYADSQGENQLDGLVYAYALDQLGLRTTESHTLIRYDVLVKTKQPAFQQVYFNKQPGDYRRFAGWVTQVLSAIDNSSFYPNFGWGCKQCQFRKTCWSM
jgi:putative RecB family exonuclease